METINTPLESLVISQLAAIRHREEALQRVFTAAGNFNPATVQTQVLELQQRADRLNRMLDAMGVANTTWDASVMMSPAAA